MPPHPHLDPIQEVAQDFQIIAEELPDSYLPVAKALTKHATTTGHLEKRQAAIELALVLHQAPPALLHCLAENLKQVHDPFRPDNEYEPDDQFTHSLPQPSGSNTERFPIFDFKIDQQAFANGLDAKFWQAIANHTIAELEEMNGNTVTVHTHPLSVDVTGEPIDNDRYMISFTAYALLHTGPEVFGTAIVFDPPSR